MTKKPSEHIKSCPIRDLFIEELLILSIENYFTFFHVYEDFSELDKTHEVIISDLSMGFKLDVDLDSNLFRVECSLLDVTDDAFERFSLFSVPVEKLIGKSPYLNTKDLPDIRNYFKFIANSLMAMSDEYGAHHAVELLEQYRNSL